MRLLAKCGVHKRGYLTLLLIVALAGKFSLGQEDGGVVFPGSSPVVEQESEVSAAPRPRQVEFIHDDEDEVERSEDCRTVSGPSRGERCVFPFIYKNVEFHGCTDIEDSKVWCSVGVNRTGYHVGGQGLWGHCDLDNCPIDREGTRLVTEDSAEHEVRGGAPQIEELISQPDEPDSEIVPCTTSQGQRGQCRPASLCVGLTSELEIENECLIPLGDSRGDFLGVCCEDRLKNDVTVSFASATDNSEHNVEGLDENRVEEFIVDRFFDGEGNSQAAPASPSGSDLEDEDSPSTFHRRFSQPSASAVDVNIKAEGLVDAANSIKFDNNLSETEAGIGLRMFNSRSSSTINKICPWTPGPRCADSKFRTVDGTCNNLKEPNYGRAITPFQRILLPKYSGKLQLPRVSVEGSNLALPSARLLSTSMTDQGNDVVDVLHTVMVMQMGQFIDHDITHTPMHTTSGCCNSDGSFPDSFDPIKCFPIPIPSDDPFWRGRKTCMSLARSLSSPGLKCELEFKQQMNQITHWLDASNIYGSTEAVASRLRVKRDGLMKVSSEGSRASPRTGMLPSCKVQPEGSFNMCNGCSSCFVAGDVRANEQLNLLVLHTVWLREHNRVANFLKRLNPRWDDERLYQEARRIVTAEYQHIVYKEWLPIILGNDYMTGFGLWPLSKGYSFQYMDSFDPRITNEFATAAFRFGHSLIPESFFRTSRRGSSRQQSMSLRESFFSPNNFVQNRGLLDDLVRGLVSQEGELWDNGFTPAVTDHLFAKEDSRAGGLDLVALNIQRGRDHGIQGYNAYREICQSGNGRARNFNDLKDLMSPRDIEKLRRLYRHVDDIDLYVGGFLERRHADSILGPTFKCIIGDQFARLKLGDRFFYDSGNFTDTRFSLPQLREIRRASMARILCDNTNDLDRIQPQVFKLPRSSRTNEGSNELR